MSICSSGWIAALCHLLLREFCLSLGSRTERGSQVLTQLLYAPPTLPVLALQGSELCCFGTEFETAIRSGQSPKALENPGWLHSCFLIPGLQPELSHPGRSRGLGWAEMVPDLSWWGWTWVEGLFWLSSHHRGALPQPFLWVGTGLGGSRTGGKKLLELAEECHHCSTHLSHPGRERWSSETPTGVWVVPPV